MPIVELSKENFESTIKENKIVLVDFWASWCMPCRMLGQELEKLSEANPDLIIGKVNVDEQDELAIDFKVRNIPHLFIFKNGKVVNEIRGYVPFEELSGALE